MHTACEARIHDWQVLRHLWAPPPLQDSGPDLPAPLRQFPWRTVHTQSHLCVYELEGSLQQAAFTGAESRPSALHP